MNKPINAKIDVTKIAKEHLFIGKQRQDGTTPKYLDVAIWENKDGPDKFGNTHYITQSISKAAREAGGRGAIIGNLTMPQESVNAEFQEAKRTTMAARPAPAKAPIVDDDSDAIPF